MTKTFRDNYNINTVQQTSYKPLFPNVQMQLKMYFFAPFVHACLHHKISESHACKDCVWPIILDAELYTTCPREQVIVVIKFNVTFLHLRHYCDKNMHLFLKRCRKSDNRWLRALMQSDSLNTTAVFYYATECSDIAVFVYLRRCHATMHSYLPGLEQFRN